MSDEEHQPVVVVMPPDPQDGGRTVRIDDVISGRAFKFPDLIEFLRRAGWLEETGWPSIEWRGGGPEDWPGEFSGPKRSV
ncbi:hypothetical protein ABZ135_38735 [Streptomyces sp. NPDC006339]|uniref:hypothetical protein n=1 Tax=Streptomyces sp. NPDC006339 TaxID=3156755 RepID=UPI0033A72F36